MTEGEIQQIVDVVLSLLKKRQPDDKRAFSYRCACGR